MRVNFNSKYAYANKTGKCPVCGKRVVRKKTFENTVNPWNKNPDGTVRTPEQVQQCVNEKADKWEPDFTHEKCL